MNSVVEVETHPPARELHYIAVLLSNVLRMDSAEVHKNLASGIHAVIDGYHAADRTSSRIDAADAPMHIESAPVAPKPIDEMDSDELDEFVGEDAAALELVIPDDDTASPGLSDSLASNARDAHPQANPEP